MMRLLSVLLFTVFVAGTSRAADVSVSATNYSAPVAITATNTQVLAVQWSNGVANMRRIEAHSFLSQVGALSNTQSSVEFGTVQADTKVTFYPGYSVQSALSGNLEFDTPAGSASFVVQSDGAMAGNGSGVSNVTAVAVSGVLTNQFYRTNSLNPILSWAGPSNSITANNGTYTYTASGDVAVTNVIGSTSGLFINVLLRITNSAATTITARYTAIGRPMGGVTTNALSIASGKVGLISTHTWGTYGTNYMTVVEQ